MTKPRDPNFQPHQNLITEPEPWAKPAGPRSRAGDVVIAFLVAALCLLGLGIVGGIELNDTPVVSQSTGAR